MQPMQATRLIVIRHGETAWNVDTRIQGHRDIALNETGVQQARAAAQALADEAIAAIYASDLQRAWMTAQAIAQRSGAPLTADPALRERSFGDFEGHTHTELAQRWPDAVQRWRERDPHWQPPGGESLSAMRARVAAALHRLAAQHVGEQIVLVAHGGVLDQWYRLATGLDLQAPRTWALGNAAINRLLWTPESLTLVGWADAGHLQTLADLG
ncbi:MAG: histidine phosphatase family protein [Rhodoferax sp.]